MKRFYFLMMLLAAMLPFGAQAQRNVYLDIDNAEAVTVLQDGSNVSIQNGVNTITYYSYLDLQIRVNEGYTMNVTDPTGAPLSPWNGTAYISGDASSEGKTWTVRTEKIVNDKSVVINVDDPSKCYVYLKNRNGALPLVAGDNTIEYCSTLNTQITIDDYYNEIYSVSADGVKADFINGQHVINLPVERVEIKTIYPDVDCKVKFTFVNAGTEAFLSRVYLNNNDSEPIESSVYLADNFTVKAGTRITMNSAGYDNYKVNAITVNGRELSFWGNGNFLVKGDTEVKIDVEKLVTQSATIKVTGDPLAINAQMNWNNINLHEGENVIEFISNRNELRITQQSHAYNVDEMTINGTAFGFDEIQALKEGDFINIVISPKAYTEHFVVYAHAAVQDMSYFEFRNQYRDPYSIKQGYQTLGLAADEVPYTSTYYDSKYANAWYYINNVLVEKEGYSLNFRVKDGDVLKMYHGSAAPAEYTVAFDGNTDECTVKYDTCKTLSDFSAPTTHLEGTLFEIAPVAKALKVSVNGVDVPAVDGKHSFNVTENAAVSVVADSNTGVEMVSAEKNAAVYNVHGIKVANSLQDAPAGLYIVGGKKVIKK